MTKSSDDQQRPRRRPPELHRALRDQGFEVLAELGRGANGRVYRAWQVALEREVAVKVIAVGGRRGTQRTLRLFREARLAGALEHPAIIRGIDAGEFRGAAWFAMELAPGETLRRLVQGSGPLRWSALDLVARALFGALAHAHERNVLHRDVKPDNIMVEVASESVRLLDLGLARHRDDPRLTQGTGTLGTPQFMAPEQARGADGIDARADLFSACATLWFAASGEVPFAGHNVSEVLTRLLFEAPAPWPTEASTRLAGVEAFLRRGLHKGPEDRFPTAAEALKEWKGLALSQGSRVGLPRRRTGGRARPPLAKPSWSRRWALLGAGLLAAVGLGVALWPDGSEATGIREGPPSTGEPASAAESGARSTEGSRAPVTGAPERVPEAPPRIPREETPSELRRAAEVALRERAEQEGAALVHRALTVSSEGSAAAPEDLLDTRLSDMEQAWSAYVQTEASSLGWERELVAELLAEARRTFRTRLERELRLASSERAAALRTQTLAMRSAALSSPESPALLRARIAKAARGAEVLAADRRAVLAHASGVIDALEREYRAAWQQAAAAAREALGADPPDFAAAEEAISRGLERGGSVLEGASAQAATLREALAERIGQRIASLATQARGLLRRARGRWDSERIRLELDGFAAQLGPERELLAEGSSSAFGELVAATRASHRLLKAAREVASLSTRAAAVAGALSAVEEPLRLRLVGRGLSVPRTREIEGFEPRTRGRAGWLLLGEGEPERRTQTRLALDRLSAEDLIALVRAGEAGPKAAEGEAPERSVEEGRPDPLQDPLVRILLAHYMDDALGTRDALEDLPSGAFLARWGQALEQFLDARYEDPAELQLARGLATLRGEARRDHWDAVTVRSERLLAEWPSGSRWIRSQRSRVEDLAQAAGEARTRSLREDALAALLISSSGARRTYRLDWDVLQEEGLLGFQRSFAKTSATGRLQLQRDTPAAARILALDSDEIPRFRLTLPVPERGSVQLRLELSWPADAQLDALGLRLVSEDRGPGLAWIRREQRVGAFRHLPLHGLDERIVLTVKPERLRPFVGAWPAPDAPPTRDEGTLSSSASRIGATLHISRAEDGDRSDLLVRMSLGKAEPLRWRLSEEELPLPNAQLGFELRGGPKLHLAPGILDLEDA